mmetsp:Transcript_5334/g.8258  ORF Transcript_5334/g.8258 Transcript_5334/m.8258 type:complete len:176 (-) Transcript_5334:650-1177(-)
MGQVLSLMTAGSPAALLGWAGLCFASAAIGGVISAKEVKTWYKTLKKPSWNPPDWIFGPVWTVLYGLMSYSAWLVHKAGGFAVQQRPLTWFLVQLGLNSIWTPLFFGAHKVGAAAVEITVLWASIAMTIFEFSHVDKTSSTLLLPYLAWVSFATALNWTIWYLNKDEKKNQGKIE